jgi:hypothetical protein
MAASCLLAGTLELFCSPPLCVSQPLHHVLTGTSHSFEAAIRRTFLARHPYVFFCPLASRASQKPVVPSFISTPGHHCFISCLCHAARVVHQEGHSPQLHYNTSNMYHVPATFTPEVKLFAGLFSPCFCPHVVTYSPYVTIRGFPTLDTSDETPY